MKRIYILFAFVISFFVSNAQNPVGYPQLFNGKWYRYSQYLGVDSALLVSSKDTSWNPKQPSLVFWQRPGIDSSFWLFNGVKWNKLNQNIDTSKISASVKYSDTASMLNPYLRKIDTTGKWLSSGWLPSLVKYSDTALMLVPYAKTYQLGSYVKYSDTSSMLNPYLRKIDTTGKWLSSGWLPSLVKYSDTASMLSPYYRTANANAALALKLNISDTSSMLSGYKTYYPRNAISAGTGISYNPTTGVITNSSPSTGGTVTSVATNNNTGITGGTITTSGTLSIDTTIISTRLWRQKGIDSVSANVNLKVNISDTANMLANYRNGIIALNADTVYQAAQIAARVKYTDTASMLSPYQRSLTAVKYSDTASMLANYRTGIIALNADTVYQAAQIAARVKYTDTASMLNNYLNGIISLNADSSYQAGQIAARVKYTDTSSMLSPYARTTALGSYVKYTDTASMLSPYGRLNYINTQLATKVNYTDTASMLSPYYRTATANAALALKVNYTDTASMLNNYLNGIIALNSDTIYQAAQIAARVKYSDTAAMLAPYTRSVSGGYLPLSGGTLTGNLNGTTANFTGFVSANGFQSAVTGVAGGSTTNMTSSSSQNWYITSGAPTTTTIVLPNATTIAIGNTYQFNNNATGGLSIQQYGGGALYTVPSGGYVEVILLSNSFSAGQWDVHVFFPSNSTAGTAGFSTTGTINSSGLDTYTSNLGSSYTSRTKVDKNYVDSSRGVDVKYSDTASMLNNYRTGIIALNADTATIQPRFNNVLGVVATKVNYTDTASMLNNYRTGIVALNADTATIQPRFNNVLGVTALKVNYTDTASMLAGYKTFYPRNAISLTTTGTSGAATYTTSTGVLNIPQYQSVLTNPITGTGTTNYLSKFTGTSTLGNSLIQDDGNGVVTMSSNSGYDINLKLNNTSQTNSLIFYQNAGTNKFGHGIISSGDWWLFWQAPALTAKMAINKTTGNLLFNKSTDNGVSAFQVSGSINQSSVTSSIIKADANGTLVASSAGTDYQAPITLTTTGTSGAATFSSNTLNIPQYQAAGTYVTSVTGTSPISSSGGTTPAISISQATTSSNGYLSSTDWNTFNGKQAALSGTGFVKISGTTISYDNSTYYLASNPNNYIALTALSATGPLSYNSGTGVFSIIQASGSTSGYLSSTDWTTFNNKQNALTNPVTGTGTTNYITKWTGTNTVNTSTAYDDGTGFMVNTTTNGGRRFVVYSASADNQMAVTGTGPSIRFADNIASPTYSALYGMATQSNNYITGAVAGDFAITWNSANNLLLGYSNTSTEKARLTSSGNFLINTQTDNGQKLQVNGTSYFGSDMFTYANGGIFFNGSGSYTSGIFQNTNGLNLQTGSTPRLTIASTGAATFSSSVTAGDLISTSYGTARIQINSTTNSSNAGLRFGAKNSSGTNNNAGLYFVSGTNTANTFLSLVADDNTYQLNVLANGNVGIGTTSPNVSGQGSSVSVLTLKGSSQWGVYEVANNANTSDGLLLGAYAFTNPSLSSGYTMPAYIGSWLSGGGSTSGGDMRFFTQSSGTAGATEKMRITSGGNVGIGTTSPAEKIDINGALAVRGSTAGYASASAVGVLDQPTTGITRLLSFGPNTSTLGSFNFYIAGANNTGGITALSIGSTGAATFSSLGTGTVYSNSGTLTNTNPSDSTLKNTITPLGYGLNEIMQLQPKTFYYNSDSTKSSLKYGFIAQDVAQIMPDMVRKIEPNNPDSKLGLESDGIYVTLVNAIKELQQEIQDLKKQIKN